MTRRRFIQSLAGIPASACFGGFAIPAFAAPVRKVALVVGNAGYAGTERLKNPVADATLTANTLRKLGFHTSLATDRNTAQLKADLDAFGQAARGADIAVFFYAGHGIAVENINYLLAVDQQLATATSLDMKRQGISLRWIESLLRQDMGKFEAAVILGFPDMQAARTWYHSEAYQTVVQHRFKGAKFRAFLTEGREA